MNDSKPVDMVEHPPHYTCFKYETADVLDEWFPFDPHLWQVGKYIARWNKKGSALENLKKARWYLNRRIKSLEEAECTTNTNS